MRGSNTRIAAPARSNLPVAARSLADAEITKHEIQQLFHIDAAGDAADGAHRQAQIFRQQLGMIGGAASPWRRCCQRFVQGVAMARPGQQQGRSLLSNLCCTFCCSSCCQHSESPSPVFREMESPSRAESPQIGFVPAPQVGLGQVRGQSGARICSCRPATAGSCRSRRPGQARGARLRLRSRRRVWRTPAVSATCNR